MSRSPRRPGAALVACALALCLAPTAAAQEEAAAVAASAPAAGPESFCEDTLGGQLWARTELYFGLSRAGGPDITDEELQEFLDTFVTPRFPAGLTVLDADGQFRGSSRMVIQERSKVLILFYPWTPGRNRAVERIRTRYKRVFEQEAVLRVDETSCVSF